MGEIPFRRKKKNSPTQYDLADLPFETDLHANRALHEPEELMKYRGKQFQHRVDGIRRILKAPWSIKNSVKHGAGVFGDRHTVDKLSAQYAKGDRRKPIVWIHVHKAGGTFMCMLAQLAGEKVVEPSDAACNWLWHDQYRDSGRADRRPTCEGRAAYMNEVRRNYSWAQIEREFSEADRCWDFFDYGTMLREPIGLLESEINYHPGCWMFGGPCGGGPKDPKRFLVEFNETLEKGRDAAPGSYGYDQFPLWKYFDNIQTRLLAPALDVPPGQINATHLALAKRGLRNFSVVTRLEDLPKTGAKVFAKLGWDPDMMGHIGEPVNSRDRNMDAFQFTTEETNWLRHVNRFDLALWEAYAPK